MPFFDTHTPFPDEEAEQPPVTEPQPQEAPEPTDDPVSPLPPANRENRRAAFASTLFDYVEIICLSLAVVLFCTMFLFRHAVVDGSSMNNTLSDGEHLITSDLFYTPAAGDVVVFEDRATGVEKPLVKRIIAVGGDTVELTRDRVYVNGTALDEPYVCLTGGGGIRDYFAFMEAHYDKLPVLRDDGTEVYRWVVPDGSVFVMGDNRFASKDSRDFGPVSVDAILGRVLIRLTPFSKFGGVS